MSENINKNTEPLKAQKRIAKLSVSGTFILLTPFSYNVKNSFH